MKSLEERQAEREERRQAEDIERKNSGYVDPEETEIGDDEDGGKKAKPKRKGVTKLADAGIEGGAGSETDNPQGGNGGGVGGSGGANPFQK